MTAEVKKHESWIEELEARIKKHERRTEELEAKVEKYESYYVQINVALEDICNENRKLRCLLEESVNGLLISRSAEVLQTLLKAWKSEILNCQHIAIASSVTLPTRQTQKPTFSLPLTTYDMAN